MTSQVDRAALEWISTMRTGRQVMEQFPEDTHLIKYEDVLGNPEQELIKMLEFCELEPDPGLIDYAKAVLRPAAPKPPFELSARVQPLFEETMRMMGYGESEIRDQKSDV
jgi:hypothetical protein